MTNRLRIVFAGTPEFSVPALRGAARRGSPASSPSTRSPTGRRGAAASCAESGETARARARPAGRAARDAQGAGRRSSGLAAYAPDLMVVVAYGLILPQAVLDLPRLGCLNIHASLLPRWRGAAPIQRAILAGDARTGVSIMQMDAGLDTGPVLLRRATRDRAARDRRRAARSARALGARGDRRRRCEAGRRAAVPRRRNRPMARPMRRRSARTRRASTGRSPPTRSIARCARSIPGRSPRRARRGSSCASGRRAR